MSVQTIERAAACDTREIRLLELVAALQADPDLRWKRSRPSTVWTGPGCLSLAMRRATHVVARDGWDCRYCGVRLIYRTVTVDHVVPTSKGGPDVLANCVLARESCNARKGDR